MDRKAWRAEYDSNPLHRAWVLRRDSDGRFFSDAGFRLRIEDALLLWSAKQIDRETKRLDIPVTPLAVRVFYSNKGDVHDIGAVEGQPKWNPWAGATVVEGEQERELRIVNLPEKHKRIRLQMSGDHAVDVQVDEILRAIASHTRWFTYNDGVEQ